MTRIYRWSMMIHGSLQAEFMLNNWPRLWFSHILKGPVTQLGFNTAIITIFTTMLFLFINCPLIIYLALVGDSLTNQHTSFSSVFEKKANKPSNWIYII